MKMKIRLLIIIFITFSFFNCEDNAKVTIKNTRYSCRCSLNTDLDDVLDAMSDSKKEQFIIMYDNGITEVVTWCAQCTGKSHQIGIRMVDFNELLKILMDGRNTRKTLY